MDPKSVREASIVRLAGVSKRFREGEGEREVLAGVDLEVARGEALALVGRSGSGKSTLLHLIGGIDVASAGSVQLFGRDLAGASEAERTRLRRERIGLVFQFFHLVPTLTVEENLLLPLELLGRTGKAARDRARAMLAEVELEDRAQSFPDRLSGGEQQRAAIARALVHEPELVLADEPTGNLDDASAERVLELFARLLRGSGTTLVLVTHSVRAMALGDRALRIHEGKLEPFDPFDPFKKGAAP